MLEVVIPEEWEFSTLANHHKRKEDDLKGRNCSWLNLTEQILKIAESIIEESIRKQVDIKIGW